MSLDDLPLRFDVEVPSDGRVEIQVPLPAGSPISVYIAPQSSEFDDLSAAATTSLEFWDNPYDDEDWNDA